MKNETPWRNTGGRFKTPKPIAKPAPDRVATLSAKLLAVGLLHLVEAAAARHHVEVADVLGRCRERNISDARAEACVALYVDANRSLPEVGRLLGLHHASVLRHLEKLAVVRRVMGSGRAA